VGGDIEDSWIKFNHVKCLKDWTTMACHVYNRKYCMVLIIACCTMQSEDVVAQIIFGKNFNCTMTENRIFHVNYKRFMADSTQAN
jgi:hypothetical protein